MFLSSPSGISITYYVIQFAVFSLFLIVLFCFYSFSSCISVWEDFIDVTSSNFESTNDTVEGILYFCYSKFTFYYFLLIIFYWVSIPLLTFQCLFSIRILNVWIIVILNPLSDNSNIDVISKSGFDCFVSSACFFFFYAFIVICNLFIKNCTCCIRY